MLLRVTKYIRMHMILFLSSPSETNFATSDNCGGQMLNGHRSLRCKRSSAASVGQVTRC